jgi:broad specificity phosphatase PhoE
MRELYLIRHGQAGNRLRYDDLSSLGREQARLLGAHLARRKVSFSRVICGALERQRATCEAFREAYGAGLPEPEVTPAWNEFDLETIFREVAPQLSRTDASFAAAYAELQQQMQDEEHAVHRTWGPCDMAVFRAWISGACSFSGESWSAFEARIEAAAAALPQPGDTGTVAVFTSATPIGIALGVRYGLDMRNRFRLASAVYNTAVTVLRSFDGELGLWTFNSVAHLEDPSLVTSR